MSFSVVLCTMKTMCYIHCYLIEMTMVINCDAAATIVYILTSCDDQRNFVYRQIRKYSY